MFKPNWGRILLYSGAVVLIHALSTLLGWSGATPAALIWAGFMLIADLLETRSKEYSHLIRFAGLSAALLVTPIESRVWLSLLVLGTGVTTLAPKLPRNQRPTRGAGLFMTFYAISNLTPFEPIGSVFLYSGIALLLAYLGAELSQRGHPWAEFVERNILGIGILGGILGLYVSVRGSLSESHPELVFYGEWLVLVLGIAAAGSIVYSYVAERDPEAYLLSQWKRHEAKTLERMGPELARAREAVEDFVLRGRKGPLLGYLAYYGAPLFEDRKKFEALIGKIADYRGREVSPLMPLWIRRAYERDELERRAGIVEEVFRELRRLMEGGRDGN